jgi:hypothetical protein
MIPTTIYEIYTQFISVLLPAERLRLASLILNNLVEQNMSVIDEGDTWTEEDILDMTAFSLQYAAATYSENNEK